MVRPRFSARGATDGAGPAPTAAYDAVVIGGGFYGCAIALELKQHLADVLLVERRADLLAGASYANQARVHRGYHYPRSILTAVRSRVNFSRFAADYAPCIVDTFTTYYAIARIGSKVNAGQFQAFCRRVGAPVGPAPREVKALFSASLVEDVFAVAECAFDARILRDAMARRLEKAGVTVACGARATRLQPSAHGPRFPLRVCGDWEGREGAVVARYAFNCTYSSINELLDRSGLPAIAVKHELAEVALIEAPAALQALGVTVMDGPFFAVMPFPARGLHSLTHVRYTPHRHWYEGPASGPGDGAAALPAPRSNVLAMINDARRFLPALADARYVESLWEVKTVLPLSEVDDSRPIVFDEVAALPGVFNVLGGKLDNVYDVLEQVTRLFTRSGEGTP